MTSDSNPVQPQPAPASGSDHPLKLISPYEFYPNQILYMDLVKQSIREAKITLIEAGTGFGKTIANLFASLEEDYFPGNIVYLSRTNQQNEQVIIELKHILKLNQSFTPSAIQIASRKFLCNVPEVINASSDSQVRLCKHFQFRYKSCIPYSKLPDDKKFDLPDVLTVSDLKAVTSAICCPYLTAQELAKEYSIISGAYNYFLDPQIRQAFDLESKIIIIDESHNIEDLLCDIYSESIREETLDESIKEMQDYIDYRKKRIASDPLEKREDFDPLRELIVSLKHFKKDLVEVLGSAVEPFESKSKVLILNNGSKLKVEFKEYTFFSSQFRKFLNLKFSKDYLSAFRKQISIQLEKLLAYYIDGSHLKQDLQLAKLENFVNLISFYYDNSKFAYQVTYYLKSNNFKLDFKCLTPEIAFRSLKNISKAVVLTSGTLSPMNLWLRILNIENGMTRIFPSVYDLQKVKVLTLGSYQSGKKLTTKYKYRLETENEVFQYYRSVILDIIHNASVTGGILIFAPSYDIIESMDLPGATIDRFSKRVPIYIEKKHQSQDLKDVDLENYKDHSVIEELQDFRTDTSFNKKSVLVGVLGGKFSEGTDFKDNQSRMVIIIGVPYPTLDPFTTIKKIFYNVKEKGLGNLWYQAQAIRKVSQALGRVCRNSKDWGLGILLDDRYLSQTTSSFDRSSQKLLSTWIQQVKEDCNSVSDLLIKMNLFYAKCLKK